MTDDDVLLRNTTGTTRARDRDEAVSALTLEDAIARNVRELRLQAGLSVADTAERIGISKAMLSKIENAQTSASLGTVARLAEGLDVPVTSLFRGADTERQSSLVKAGQGAPIVRAGSQEGHAYELLGSLRGEHKRLECLLVTLTQDSSAYPVFQHPGTEFLYLLDGVMDYAHGSAVHRLHPGDALEFDGQGAHGPVALVETPIRFLSVVAFPDSAV